MSQLLFQAKLLFYIVLANVLALLVLMTIFGNSGYKNFVFREVCENGGNSSNDILNS
jgi:hypothetical protein